VESALEDGLRAVQPPQIQDHRASVLAQRTTGEFAVVSLEKRESGWTIVGVLNASQPAKPARQQ
jgi:hypothetical protein